jgi:signal recognition particle GTPase
MKSQNKTTIHDKISIEQYLKKVARFANSDYGKLVRNQFQDIEGASELAMLAAPSDKELDQLEKAVAIMTPDEKENAGNLTDQQIQRIAADARIDPAVFAIFINGYAIHYKRVSQT